MYGPTGKLALMNGQTEIQSFQPFPGGGVFVHRPGSLTNWRHPDVLGSSRLATTLPGRIKFYDVAYAPFGEDYNGSGTTDLSFTGQTQDTTSTVGGLYDFQFREYAARQGRWVSPDPAGVAAVSLTNPQSWNRYAYVGNSPLAFTDPLGLVCIPGHCDYWGEGGDGGMAAGETREVGAIRASSIPNSAAGVLLRRLHRPRAAETAEEGKNHRNPLRFHRTARLALRAAPMCRPRSSSNSNVWTVPTTPQWERP
jgi:RHS repeat-associated protein